MGKKKNKNKLSGAVKTAAKTEKKLASKLKKELANLGEDDISKVIAQIEKEEAKRATATEKTLSGPPTPRAYATLTPHPTNNELILFGGEYHNGKTTEVYNELLFFNTATNVWKKLKAPGAPPPRSAHQAIVTQSNKGELWIFGGEFTSPSETQFYHYKDLWCFNIGEKKWEKVVAPNGPSARSGHRMVLVNRKILVFGGYNDDGRESKYFDDLHAFCLDSRQWAKVELSGRGPCARSACIMLPIANESLVVYGGFSRSREGRTERTFTHTDAFRVVAKANDANGTSGPGIGTGAWTWKPVGRDSRAPPPRASQASAFLGMKGYVFGGVADVEETDEELRGEMSDELQMLDLETLRWHDVAIKGDQPAASQQTEVQEVENTAKKDVTVFADDVFTVKLGSAPSPSPAQYTAPATPPRTRPRPCARMSAMMAAQRSVLYLYGGVLEKDDKQFYLSDMYSLDLHKLNEWKTIIAQPPLPDWLGSDSEETGSGSDTETESSSETSDEE